MAIFVTANNPLEFSISYETEELSWAWNREGNFGNAYCELYADNLLIVDCEDEYLVYNFDELIERANDENYFIVQNLNPLTDVNLVVTTDPENRYHMELESMNGDEVVDPVIMQVFPLNNGQSLFKRQYGTWIGD